MKTYINRAIAITFLMAIASSSFAANIITQRVKTRTLSTRDENWFMDEFPKSYMHVYRDKTFTITDDDGMPVILGPKDDQRKLNFLIKTAQEEFINYVTNPRPGYKADLILLKDEPIGALLFRELPEEKTIYLAQFFIKIEFQKKGIGTYILQEFLPPIFPDYNRYEVLARHQNNAAFSLYQSAGFTLGDETLVRKYDYLPERYMSFYKTFRDPKKEA